MMSTQYTADSRADHIGPSPRSAFAGQMHLGVMSRRHGKSRALPYFAVYPDRGPRHSVRVFFASKC